MKKIARLMTLAFATLILASCEDVPSPFGTVAAPKEEEAIIVTPSGSGTAADPYNVAGVIEATKDLASGSTTTTEYYVTGYVSSVSQYREQYNSLNYYISDDEDGLSNKFYVYSGSGLNGAAFTSKEDLPLGTKVTVCGKITNYNGTIEFQSQNKIVEWNGQKAEEPTSTIGTKENPISVSDALTRINALADGGKTSEKAYVKGKVVKVTTNQANFDKFGNLNYLISDDGTEANTVTVYSGDGLNGEKFSSITDIAAGDEVIVFGTLYKYVNKSGTATPEIDSGNYLVSLTKGTGSGDTPTSDEPKKVSVAEFLAASESTSVWYQLTGTVTHLEDGTYTNSTQYGNFDLIDESGSIYVYGVVTEKGGSKGKFADLMAAKGIKDGCKITIIGNRGSYQGNAQVVNAYFVSVEAASGNDTGGDTSGSSVASLTNGDFETWADGLPTGWKSASTASSATLSQSTDAHGGTYSCNVNGNEGSNKRLACQEITLAAGTYVFSAWIKATTTDKAQARMGYVPVKDGTLGSYAYDTNYCELSTNWQQFTYEFTLTDESTVCLVIMNPKKSNYSSGKDILVDDATLTKK